MARYLTALLVTVVAWGLAGCSHERADPQAEEIVKARDEARGRVAPSLSVVGDAREVARVELDFCREGQYDWKIKEPFRSECQLQTAVAFTFGGDFRQRATAIHEGLKARGWAESMGVPGSFDVWDKQDASIGRIPSSLYKDGELRRVWVVFQASAAPPETFYPHLGTADQVNSEKPISTYYSATTGTPWAVAWEQAGRPGPYLVVLKFEDAYHRQPR
ncbi:hypothetical protein [Allorhizocola rhizosphaerae]|uniref:hypothetical protein n=1 Tax=Allorhizocola rhizosphaerae TaxID=1872709 RepID=UPI0013C33084|nr:hypothetical protein [Allorhizocola rhizosphaerae]